MVQVGYTLMCEQSGPRALVENAVRAEEVGFDFAVISDHFSPWLAEQGHSPFAWSVLAAALEATDSLPFATFVTCPTIRYHPAVVAQMAATTELLAPGRFTLGLGAGENLNEHVVGRGWPPVHIRHDMLAEAVCLIRELWTGQQITERGEHFPVDRAVIHDVPDSKPPIGIAASGRRSVGLAADLGDALIMVEPKADLVTHFRDGGGADKPVYGQLPISFDTDESRAARRAHEQFRWFGGGWAVNSELPTPRAFAAASSSVTESEVAASIPCGSDVDRVVETVEAWRTAGFTHLALLQIGGDVQDDFLGWAAKELLPALAQR
jgi:G6PDH family F420-dependent oxidoreductase